MDQNVRISKTLSYILRHNARKMGLNVREDGSVLVNDLLKLPRLKGVTLDKIKQVVSQDNKQRYTLYEDQDSRSWYIRANQGHSMKIDALPLRKVVSPDEIPIAVHGTYLTKWVHIKNQGLKTMNRQHIHLAPGLPGESKVISGMRASADIYIYIDVKSAMDDGIEFFISENNVILTSGIDGVLPTRHFKKVDTRSGNLLSPS